MSDEASNMEAIVKAARTIREAMLSSPELTDRADPPEAPDVSHEASGACRWYDGAMTRRRLTIALVMTLAAVALAKLVVLGPSPMPPGPVPYTERPDDRAGLDALRQLREEQVEDDREED